VLPLTILALLERALLQTLLALPQTAMAQAEVMRNVPHRCSVALRRVVPVERRVVPVERRVVPVERRVVPVERRVLQMPDAGAIRQRGIQLATRFVEEPSLGGEGLPRERALVWPGLSWRSESLGWGFAVPKAATGLSRQEQPVRERLRVLVQVRVLVQRQPGASLAASAPLP
jgi:hypothetical protein